MSGCSLKGLYLGESIPELFSLPTSLEFTRDYVAKNLPVVIRGATAEWSACTKWNSSYFRYVINMNMIYFILLSPVTLNSLSQ